MVLLLRREVKPVTELKDKYVYHNFKLACIDDLKRIFCKACIAKLGILKNKIAPLIYYILIGLWIAHNFLCVAL